MDGTIDPGVCYIDQVASEAAQRWPNIRAARQAAEQVKSLLCESLTKQVGPFSTSDLDVVAFGSLARQEWTAGSDVDWTMLIDGQATPDHRRIAREIKKGVGKTEYNGKVLQPPGSEGIFGAMAFSHDIIHHIGGQADTNRNTTQRILLLLEAFPLRHVNRTGELGPYERVVSSILFRYLHDDTNFVSVGTDDSRIPRFLLNDVVRYWRTMCVDFAYKGWEQGGGKWALRNIKLRMSRKLLFVSALLTVFSCFRNPLLRFNGETKVDVLTMQSHLMNFVRSTPLNIVAWSLCKLGLSENVGKLFDHYDAFIAKLNDGEIRGHLQNLDPKVVYEDQTFLQVREICHHFQHELSNIFFKSNTDLREFTFEYGVF